MKGKTGWEMGWLLLLVMICAPSRAQDTPPTAKNTKLVMVEGVEHLSLNLASLASDAEQPPYSLTYTLISAPAQGTVERFDAVTRSYLPIEAGETAALNWTYTPAPGFIGTESFTWRCNDGTSDSNTATYTIQVNANTLPVAQDSKMILIRDTTLTVPAPFVDPDAVQARTFSLVSAAAHGQATIAGGNLTYTPEAGYVGRDAFSWKVSDGFGDSNVATCSILVRQLGDRAGMLVVLVVNDLLYPEIEAEMQRLALDLESGGYSTLIRTWSTTQDGGARDLWNTLRGEYLAADRFMAGAILIGTLPTVRNLSSNETTDLVYWNLGTYQDINRRDIWVSRLWALQGSTENFDGFEVLRLRRALQANHDYRTGVHRLPHTAHYVMDAYPEMEPTYYPGEGANALEVWPSVEKSSPSDAWLEGGELLDETMHGSGLSYQVYNILQNRPCKVRFTLATSCGTGGVNGPVNNLLYSRGGGAVLSVGASATTYTGAFTMLENGLYDGVFRARLAGGESWGDGLVASYPFGDQYRAFFFGDLSLPVLAAPANALPTIDSFQADQTRGPAPLTVHFTASASDPDGMVDQIDWFCENEWIRMLKQNTGPTYTNNNRDQTHTYERPYRYLAEVQARDDRLAISRPAQIEIVVGPTPGQEIRVNCGTDRWVAKYFDPTQEFIDSSGLLWMHDQGYVNGSWGISGNPQQGSVAGEVAGTEDDPLYRDFHYCLDDQTYGYRVPVENGLYTLRLGFADMKSAAAGERLTDVSVEEQLLAEGLDVFAQAGPKTAMERDWQVEVADGELTLTLSRNPAATTREGGLLSWFEVIPGGSGNQRPVAAALADPISGAAPLAVSFDGSGSSDGDGTLVDYAWDFGDGASGGGTQVVHTYLAAGDYTALLTVTDDQGAFATDTVSVTVQEPEIEPDGGSEPDSGVEPDGGSEPDSGVEPDEGDEPDAGIEPDAGSEPEPDEHLEPGSDPGATDDPGAVDEPDVSGDPARDRPGLTGFVSCSSAPQGRFSLGLVCAFLAPLLLFWCGSRRRAGRLLLIILGCLSLLAGCEGSAQPTHPSDLFNGAGLALSAVQTLRDVSLPLADRRQRLRALADIDEPEATRWLMQMGDQPFYLNWAAVEELGRSRRPVPELSGYLEQKLAHADVRISSAAVRALGKREGPRAVASLAGALVTNRTRPDGHEILICTEIVRVLGELAAREAVPSLHRELERVEEPGWDLGYGGAILDALQRIGAPQSAPALRTYADRLATRLPEDPIARAEVESRIRQARRLPAACKEGRSSVNSAIDNRPGGRYQHTMPRGPRLDVEGALHHVMVRGIERRDLFLSDDDRRDLVERLRLSQEVSGLRIYAWSFLPNHFHLLVRSGPEGLSFAMRRVLTGYAVGFNRRHRRAGHLFQNRFKSILVEEDPYFLELVRYIHLNPVRAGLVEGMRGLDGFEWSGHAALVGRRQVDWQDTAFVLEQFGSAVDKAREAYRVFVTERVRDGRRPELGGGGLVRSAGGRNEVAELKRGRERWAYDERVLGSGEFVQEIQREVEKRAIEARRKPEQPWKQLDSMITVLSEKFGIETGEVRSGSRRRQVVAARGAIGYLAVRVHGIPLKAVARVLNVSSQSVLRGIEAGRELVMARKIPVDELAEYRN